MTANRRSTSRLILGASIAIAIASGGAGHADAERALELLVINAVTAEEHAEAARFYAEKARDAREEEVRHREMGARYTDGAVSDVEQRREQRGHCENIASLHAEMAEEYEALARIHSERARRVGAETNPRTR